MTARAFTFYCGSCGRLNVRGQRERFGRPVCDHRGEAAHGAPRLMAPAPTEDADS